MVLPYTNYPYKVTFCSCKTQEAIMPSSRKTSNGLGIMLITRFCDNMAPNVGGYYNGIIKMVFMNNFVSN